ncbi:MAG: Flp pilus assembly complex ATPase component [bacterium]|nr:Flp pilus assembly complex ATPase component [bacterium]
MPKTDKKQPRRSFIGEVLLKDDVLTEKQLDRALRVQRHLEQSKQLGELLIELGLATKHAIAEAIRKHGQGIRLGDMLLEQGLISQDSLDAALAIQKERGVKLGEALIELGATNERIILQNLASQRGIPYIEPSFAMVDGKLLSGVSPDYLEKNVFLPFSRDDEGVVTVVAHCVQEQACLDAIGALYAQSYRLALGPRDAIIQAVAEYRNFRLDRDSAVPDETADGEEMVVQLVDHLLAQAVIDRASDIHIEPMSGKIRIRYRIDGVLVYKTDLPLDLLPKIISRLKILAEMNITEHQRHQGGRIFQNIGGREFDLRLSVYVSVHGESAVVRLLNKELGLVSLDGLGMTQNMMERFRTDVLELPTGVVLITGPTGSGKTTTLYSSLDYCNDVDTKIITAEDPVEYMIDGLVQCSIFEKVGRTFEATLREIVRQDPDIIVLGEIRDRTTAETAIQAALTGHKVYSTFHTEDTIGGLLRLIDMDIETFLISSTVISVLAQRLLRRVCSQCGTPYTPKPHELDRLGLEVADVREHELKRGQGCTHCNHTGYRGRVGAYELLVLNEPVKEAILQKRPAHAIRTISMETTGMISMREDAIGKAVRGGTTLSEVLRHTPATGTVRPLRQILAMTQ